MRKLDDILKIFISQILTKVCEMTFLVIVIWHFIQSYSALDLSFFLILASMPNLIMFFFSEKCIEKLGVLRTIQYTDLGRGIIYLSLGIFVASVNIIMVCGLIIAGNFFGSLFSTAIMLLPKYLAEDKRRDLLNAKFTLCLTFSGLVGPALACILYKYFDLRSVILLIGLVYLITAAIGFTIPNRLKYQIENTKKPGHTKFNIFNFKPILLLFLLLFFVGLLMGSIEILLPLFVKEFYFNKMYNLAIFQTSAIIGAILGGGLLSLKLTKGNPWKKIQVAYLFTTASYLIFAVSRSVAFAVISLFGMGLCSTMGEIFVLNYLQSHPNESHLPKIMAYNIVVLSLSYPFAMLCTGLSLIYMSPSKLAIIYPIFVFCILLLIIYLKSMIKSEDISWSSSKNYQN